MLLIVFRILIVSNKVLCVIDIEIVRMVWMKHNVNTVSQNQYSDMMLNDILGHHHEPLSPRSKTILFFVLVAILSFALSSIFICYFCCEITNNNNNHLSFITKHRKSGINLLVNIYFFFSSLFHLVHDPGMEEIGGVVTPLLSSTHPEKT